MRAAWWPFSTNCSPGTTCTHWRKTLDDAGSIFAVVGWFPDGDRSVASAKSRRASPAFGGGATLPKAS